MLFFIISTKLTFFNEKLRKILKSLNSILNNLNVNKQGSILINNLIADYKASDINNNELNIEFKLSGTNLGSIDDFYVKFNGICCKKKKCT